VLLMVVMAFVSQSKGQYPWRTRMTGPDSCWTNVTCNRALIVSHGGDWDPVFYPYDSFPAFRKAWKTVLIPSREISECAKKILE